MLKSVRTLTLEFGIISLSNMLQSLLINTIDIQKGFFIFTCMIILENLKYSVNQKTLNADTDNL